jgi:hypothetical protein
MILKRRAFPILVTLLALGAATPVRATLVQRLSVPELVQRSTTIVHGTVQETHIDWEGGRARLYTYVTISAAEFLKGAAPGRKTITFRQLGGRDGDTIVTVPGSPRFSLKEEVLLFLTGDDAGGYPQVMGIFQGAFRPVPGRGLARGVEGLTAGAAASLRPDPGRGAAAPAPPLPASFDGFLGLIRNLVREQAQDSHP